MSHTAGPPVSILQVPPSRTDGELLQRFAAEQDDAAFAELVDRYGALVLGVCRRVLHHAEDAEDAFQATFLILARKARSIRRQQALGGWLYKVAYRTALRARAHQAQRQARELAARRQRDVLTLPGPAVSDVGELLDEEVRRLPEKYRDPVLLCYLQGRTNEEAARQLRCPTGTVKIRLLRARELLRKRLTRRGLALTVTALLAACAAEARAAVPEALRAATCRMLAGAGPSAPVAALAGRVLKRMALARVKVALALLLTVLLLALADGLTQQAQGATLSPGKGPAAKPLFDPYQETAPAPAELLVERPGPGPRPRS
jgi:RNA polymerase sigma factor (sigma-70 family)